MEKKQTKPIFFGIMTKEGVFFKGKKKELDKFLKRLIKIKEDFCLN